MCSRSAQQGLVRPDLETPMTTLKVYTLNEWDLSSYVQNDKKNSKWSFIGFENLKKIIQQGGALIEADRTRDFVLMELNRTENVSLYFTTTRRSFLFLPL